MDIAPCPAPAIQPGATFITSPIRTRTCALEQHQATSHSPPGLCSSPGAPAFQAAPLSPIPGWQGTRSTPKLQRVQLAGREQGTPWRKDTAKPLHIAFLHLLSPSRGRRQSCCPSPDTSNGGCGSLGSPRGSLPTSHIRVSDLWGWREQSPHGPSQEEAVRAQDGGRRWVRGLQEHPPTHPPRR